MKAIYYSVEARDFTYAMEKDKFSSPLNIKSE